MKNKILLSLIALMISGVMFSQSFKGNVSTMYGILNPKIRFQYEMPVKNRASFGLNMNYYLVNWTGPVFEPFFRIYGKRDGNVEGFFFQTKLIYGNLSTLDWDLGYYKNKRWSTVGAGINMGYKFLVADHFTIEPMMGFRYMSAPTVEYNQDFDGELTNLAEDVGWYLTTGLPIEFQLKLGYQF